MVSGSRVERRGRRLVAAALAGLLLGTVFPVSAALADTSGNIPGVPLPSGTVSGDLGGSIYDIVYRVDVPAGYVLLASMTGTSGTDYDLYVFDSTATDIYANPPVGLAGKSTGPTSTESVSVSSVAGGRYYIDLAAFSRTAGQYHLTVRIASDTTAPTVGLVMDGGAPATNDPVVTVSVVANDDLSGVAGMQLSEDGTAWTEWAPYSVIVLWTFSSVDGVKPFYVRVRDLAGNVSSVARGQIVLDTVAPTVVSVSPSPGGPTSGLQPVYAIRFSEPINESSWLANGLRVSDPYGTPIFGTLRYDRTTSTGTFTPSAPLVAGRVYSAELSGVADLAGNPVPERSWTNTAMTSVTVTLTASATIVRGGSAVVLDGSVGSLSAAPVTLERAIGNGPYVEDVPLLTATGGRFRSIETVTQNTWFRAVYAGSDTVAGASSPAVRVLVRRVVALSGRTAGTTYLASRGHAVSLKAVLGPTTPDVAVTFRIYRRDSSGRLVLQSATARTSVRGSASLAWTPKVAGRYVIRVTTPSTPLFANGTSPSYSWLVP